MIEPVVVCTVFFFEEKVICYQLELGNNLFSELKLVPDNLFFIYAETN